jgi:hypothetical protein
MGLLTGYVIAHFSLGFFPLVLTFRGTWLSFSRIHYFPLSMFYHNFDRFSLLKTGKVFSVESVTVALHQPPSLPQEPLCAKESNGKD